MREIKVSLNKRRYRPYLCCGRLSVFNTVPFPKLMHRFNAILIKISAEFWWKLIILSYNLYENKKDIR